MVNKQSPKVYNSELCLFDGVKKYHVFNHMVLPIKNENETTMTFTGKSEAVGFIVRCLDYMQNDQLVRNFLATRNIKSHTVFSRQGLAELAADQISAFPLLVVPVSEIQNSGGSESSQEKEKPETDEWAIPFPIFSKKHIKFKFIDKKSGRPVEGVAARIIGSSGNFKDTFSDKAGFIKWDNIKPGLYSLSSVDLKQSDYTLKDTLSSSKNEIASTTATGEHKISDPDNIQKYYLAKITQHRVSDGETLQSIAEKNNMTFKKLAYFNWGSYDTKTILECMRRDIGCSKPTQNGRDYNFESSDKPGVIFIPQPFKEDNFQISQTHIITVFATGFQIFHESFQTIIKDENGQPLEDITCELKQPDGSSTIEVTDKNGMISLSGINVKKIKISVLGNSIYTAKKRA